MDNDKRNLKFLWLLRTVLITLFLTMFAPMFLCRQKKLEQNPSHIVLLTNQEPTMLSPRTQDIVKSHRLSRVKVKKKPASNGSLHLFSLKNEKGTLTGYAAKKDDETWCGADFRVSVDFLKTQNDSDTPESTIEENLLEAQLIDRSRRPGTADSPAFYAFLFLSNPLPVSARDRNGTTRRADSGVTFIFFGDSTKYGESAVFEFENRSSIVLVPDQAQPQSRAQKKKKSMCIIQSERKQIQRRKLKAYEWLRPARTDAFFYRPFKKTTSVSLENGNGSAGGSLWPLKRSLRPFRFRGSGSGYSADRDGSTHGPDFWDFFDPKIDEDHARISHISEFEISVHFMNLKKLKIERQRHLSIIHDKEQILNASEKRNSLLEKGCVIRHENGGRKKLVKVTLSNANEEEIQVHPNSASWEWEFLNIQKPILASIAFFQSKTKHIEKEISIKEQLPLLEHADKDGPRIRDREKKNEAAMLRYKRQSGKRQLSSSYQKLKEPVGGQKPYPWRQMEDVSYYRSVKKIKAGKPLSAFQRTRTNPLLLDLPPNDLFDVREESQ